MDELENKSELTYFTSKECKRNETLKKPKTYQPNYETQPNTSDTLVLEPEGENCEPLVQLNDVIVESNIANVQLEGNRNTSGIQPPEFETTESYPERNNSSETFVELDKADENRMQTECKDDCNKNENMMESCETIQVNSETNELPEFNDIVNLDSENISMSSESEVKPIKLLKCETDEFPECETDEHLEYETDENRELKAHRDTPDSETFEHLELETNENLELVTDEKPECDKDDGMIYDEYGFACVDAKNDTIERQHEYTKSALSESQQQALSKFLDQISGDIDNKSLGKLQSHIRRGIPHHLRGKLWKAVLGINKLQASSKFNYLLNVQLLRQQLVDLNISEYCSSKLASDSLDDYNVEFYEKSHIPVTVIRQISVDVDRTFPLHRRFRGNGVEGVEGRAALFRVLAVYARYNPAVGYCQGMSYIVGMLLMNLDEVDAFWVMVVLFEKAKYLSGYFNSSMGRIQRHAEVFKCLLKQRKPLLYRHLEKVGVHPLMFITPWFMCLYTSLPCWDTVLSIWDHLIMQGVTVIFRVGLALLEIIEDKIMSTTDMSLILPSLLHVPVAYAKSDSLLPVLWETTVHRWEIDSIQAIVDEEIEKAKQGRKRALMADEYEQKSKRHKTNAAEGSLFKRIVNIFTPASQRQQGPSLGNKSQVVATKKRKERHRKYPGHVVTRQQTNQKEQDEVSSTERRLSSVSISPPPKENDETTNPLAFQSKDITMKAPYDTRYRGRNTGKNNSGNSKALHTGDVTLSPKSTRRCSKGFQFDGVRRSPRISSTDYRSRLEKKTLENWKNPFNTPSNRKLISSSAKVQHAFKMFHTPTPLRNNQGRCLQPSPFFSSPEIEMSTIDTPRQPQDP
ncbi:uncharacterized protein [Antedon mediterranea]|uniref:uncharacterized protein isoform X2 n=1 Tax=Antedon mediterranea TaxID=105859 RepID=UPI003AF7DB97